MLFGQWCKLLGAYPFLCFRTFPQFIGWASLHLIKELPFFSVLFSNLDDVLCQSWFVNTHLEQWNIWFGEELLTTIFSIETLESLSWLRIVCQSLSVVSHSSSVFRIRSSVAALQFVHDSLYTPHHGHAIFGVSLTPLGLVYSSYSIDRGFWLAF